MTQEPRALNSLIELNDMMNAGDAFLPEPSTDLAMLAQIMPSGTSVAIVTTESVMIVPVHSERIKGVRPLPIADWIDDSKKANALFGRLHECGVRRVFLLDSGRAAAAFARKCRDSGVEPVTVGGDRRVSSDDYITEEESEAVAERLRQLGYL